MEIMSCHSINVYRVDLMLKFHTLFPLRDVCWHCPSLWSSRGEATPPAINGHRVKCSGKRLHAAARCHVSVSGETPSAVRCVGVNAVLPSTVMLALGKKNSRETWGRPQNKRVPVNFHADGNKAAGNCWRKNPLKIVHVKLKGQFSGFY